MSEDEMVSPLEKAKKTVLDTIPYVLIGTLIVILTSASRLDESGIETLKDIIRTGGYILLLKAFYYIGYTLHYFFKEYIFSRFTHEERSQEYAGERKP